MTIRLGSVPEFDVPWDQLSDAVQEMSQRAASAGSYLMDAGAAWSGLKDAYRQPDTELEVHAALAELEGPTQEWTAALGAARDAVAAFVAAGRPLQAEAEELAAARPALAAQLAGLDGDEPPDDNQAERVLRRAEAFNGRIASLRADWQALRSETAAALKAISGGTLDSLPATPLLAASAALPAAPPWASFTSGLNERFGPLTPESYLASLTGLTDQELRDWAAANPEGAALLATNTLPAWRLPGSAEAVMARAMANDAGLTEAGISTIRDAWKGLAPDDQERLLLLYPAVFGALNGVPFTNRIRANTLTAAGYRETVATQQEQLGTKPDLNDYLADARNTNGQPRAAYQQAYNRYMADLEDWEAEHNRLATLRTGLDFAVDHQLQVVTLSLEGDGRIVTMDGALGPGTRTIATLVPGTGADLGQLEAYTRRLDAVNGEPSTGTVSFYWQGTDLPNEITDNITTSFNEDGGPLLAAFDHALDLETRPDARTTYIGYSAGGSLLGTGEREGLDSTNIVYVAPAGTGHNVGSPADTANPDAHRYWLQTRDDPISAAQLLGGGYHGPSFWRGGSPTAMDPVRLETGFLSPDNPDSLMGGHTDYFRQDSTSATNIQGVIEGTEVSPYVEDQIHQTYSAYGPLIVSPLEQNPEDYAYGNLETVTVESLEK
ncbi:alpha/beta hydrolase [Arthrobacter sp. NPDC055138]